ncbi:hypothetical protein N7613_01010 [Pseudomonas juntendi]|uniref:hypothetical protein n=1 Tax=Pseudomonas TaxID=286 RepID=UPI0018E672C4|nr:MULTISPECIES: hypothetical protein [Pseudomonas]MBI6912453.1 hypothetical protein [Pseudomonas juntendi]MDG9807210.1 hypothetical protein [Pseudomonas juntendi]
MNNDGLIKSIDALLSLDARGSLIPHGIGELARELLEKCVEALTQSAEPDELTDLATWKRRAIEAESKLRTYDPRILELSQREVESLLAEPRPKDIVLMKCVLCDQLQADLTNRDEEIDGLRQAITKVRKTVCMPKQIEDLLDSAMERRP